MKMTRRDFLAGCAAASTVAVIPGFLSSCAARGAPLIPKPGGLSYENTYFARHFGIEEQTLRTVMARALRNGGDFCDVYLEHSAFNYVGLEDGEVNKAYTEINLGAGIRVVNGLRFGYAFTEELTLESMLKAADTASAIASGASSYQPVEFGIVQPPNHYPIDTTWEKVGIDRKMPWLQEVNERIFTLDSRVIKANITYIDSSKRILVATSEGLVMEDHQPQTMLAASCVAEDKGRRERGMYNYAAKDGPAYYTPGRLNTLAEVAVRRTVTLFGATRPPAGEFPVVLGPGPSGILLHEAIGHGMEADFNRKNVSIFSDRIGRRVAIPDVTIIDNGTNPHVRGSLNMDDEGNLGQRTVLVEEGVMKSYLHDRISARFYKVKPTGSGRRQSFRYAPMPRMRNTYMEGGPHEAEEIIRSVKKGIYAEAFSNGQVKIGEGSFAFYISSGRMIEDGRLTSPIKDVNIIGNGPEVLSRITMVGNDPMLDVGGWTCGKNGQRVPVSQGLPTTLVSAITVGGTRV